MFKGALTALVSPFNQDGTLDVSAFADLIEWQIAEGIDGLVPCGTTGESPTLSHDEHKKLIELCVSSAKKRVPVVAGAGSNNTIEAIELAQHAQSAGADAVLVVTPYYNKPNQEGLLQHFVAVANAISIPLIIYNIPGRSIVDIMPETMAKMVKAATNIVGVKDATCSMQRVAQQRYLCGADFIQLSGDDTTSLGFRAQGGVGCISVTSNVAPKLCAQMQAACDMGDYAKALEINDKLAPLHDALFYEPNPAGIKYALARINKIQPVVRLPMVQIKQETALAIDAALAHAGLI